MELLFISDAYFSNFFYFLFREDELYLVTMNINVDTGAISSM